MAPDTPIAESEHGISTLPREILHQINTYLETDETKAARLVLRCFDEVGLQKLFHTITLTAETRSVQRLWGIVTHHQRNTQSLRSMTKMLIIDLSLLWYPTLTNGNSNAELSHPFSLSHSAPIVEASLERLGNLESVTITTRDVDSRLGPWVFKDFNPEPTVLRIWNHLRPLSLKELEIRSGRQMQLSLSLFSTRTDVYSEDLPLHGTALKIQKEVIQSQISTAPEAFRGLRELTLDIYDHDYARSTATDNTLRLHNFLPDVLRASSASLRRLELNLNTPGEAPHSMWSDICLYHGTVLKGGPLERTGKVPSFADIVPRDIEFACLESMKMTNVYYHGKEIGVFLAKHTNCLHTMVLSFWACRTAIKDSVAMKLMRESARSEETLRVLTLKQVENPHQDLCIGLGPGTYFHKYCSINAADLATMYAAGMTTEEVIFTISYGAPLRIRWPTLLRSWAVQVSAAAAEHHEQKTIAEAKKSEVLAGKDGDALVAYGRLKLRVLTELLRAVRDAQTPFDDDFWTHIVPIEWVGECMVNLEVFCVEGTYRVFAWGEGGWRELMVGTHEVTGKLQVLC